MAIHRQNSTNEAPHEKEQHGTKRGGKRPAAGGETLQLIFTLNAATGAVISIEKVDPDGKRHNVRPDETVALAGKGNLREIEAALDDAFEASPACWSRRARMSRRTKPRRRRSSGGLFSRASSAKTSGADCSTGSLSGSRYPRH
jgi:hypothetical protein